MRSPAGTRGREGYSVALAELWEHLGRTMSSLDSLAATPAEQLLHDAAPVLPRLQYELHAASEAVLGLEPPAEALDGHEELSRALATARDATAELLDAVESGDLESAAAMTYEWRGALFAVRLARLRLGAAGKSAAFFEQIEGRNGARRTAAGGLLLVAVALAGIFASAAAGLSPAFAGVIVLLAAAALFYRA